MYNIVERESSYFFGLKNEKKNSSRNCVQKRNQINQKSRKQQKFSRSFGTPVPDLSDKCGGSLRGFYFHPYLGKIPILTNIFQRGWNHQLDDEKESLIIPFAKGLRWLFAHVFSKESRSHSKKVGYRWFFQLRHLQVTRIVDIYGMT